MTIIGTQASGVNSAKLQQEMTDIDTGVLKDIPAKTTVMINGTAMTQAQIDTQLKSYIGTFAAADTAKSAYQAALVARRNVQVEARDFYLQLKKAVIAYFGAQSAQLADFGLSPAKAKVPKTSAEKAIIAAKAKLTRQARGTTSKKQKAAINPGLGTPAAGVAPTGKLQPFPPSVTDGAVPGSTAPTASSSTATGSSGTSNASNTTTSVSAPAATGSGTPASS
jgi:hypothetical protein